MVVVQLTYCKIDPQRVEEAKTIFNRDIIPVMRDQEGNVGIRLLEPKNPSEDFIFISEWRSRADAQAHEKSGVRNRLLNKLDSFIVNQPVVKTYFTEDVKIFTGVF